MPAARVLAIFQDYGYPVDWKPKITKRFMIGAELSLERL
jgi:hypothetical protein